MPVSVRVVLDLSDSEAGNCAQFVKRTVLGSLCACAVDDEEAYVIRDSVAKLERALADVGYAPR